MADAIPIPDVSLPKGKIAAAPELSVHKDKEAVAYIDTVDEG